MPNRATLGESATRSGKQLTIMNEIVPSAIGNGGPAPCLGEHQVAHRQALGLHPIRARPSQAQDYSLILQILEHGLG